MLEPHPNLTSFINFANASERSRETVVKKIRLQSTAEYSPATDYWKRMRDATKRDRATTRDGAAVFATAANATEKKQSAFGEIAARWEGLLPRWADSHYQPPKAGIARLWGLDVSVSPRFIEAWPTGMRERTFVYFNQKTLSIETIDEVLRVIQLAYPGDDATPALIDVRRNKVHTRLSADVVDIDDRIAALSEEFRMGWAA